MTILHHVTQWGFIKHHCCPPQKLTGDQDCARRPRRHETLKSCWNFYPTWPRVTFQQSPEKKWKDEDCQKSFCRRRKGKNAAGFTPLLRLWRFLCRKKTKPLKLFCVCLKNKKMFQGKPHFSLWFHTNIALNCAVSSNVIKQPKGIFITDDSNFIPDFFRCCRTSSCSPLALSTQSLITTFAALSFKYLPNLILSRISISLVCSCMWLVVWYARRNNSHHHLHWWGSRDFVPTHWESLLVSCKESLPIFRVRKKKKSLSVKNNCVFISPWMGSEHIIRPVVPRWFWQRYLRGN